jgi:Ca2+-transporting ATPase
MILTDDNFATIVKAVEYGRAIYDNLAKYIRFQMGMLCAFILTYLGATIFGILGGVPFSTLVVLWINFAIQVPIAMALGFDSPSPGLMDRKPRPLSQPVLSRPQWLRLVFTGLLIAFGTLILETRYEAVDPALAATMGFVVFSLFNIALGLSARSETGTVFNRYNLADRRQLGLYGLALLLLLLPVEFGIGSKILLTTDISGDQWLICIAFALGMLLIDEVIKFFMRRSRTTQAKPTAQPIMAPSTD